MDANALKGKSIVLFLLIATILIFLAVKALSGSGKQASNQLTREQMQSILLKGNKYAGQDIENMTDAQLLAAIQAGGYVLTV